MENKKNTKFIVIAIVAALVFAGGITYAYFAASVSNTASKTVTAKTSDRDVFTTSGEVELSMDITNDVMQQSEGKNDYSVYESDDGTFTVSLTAGSGKATCTYDIALSDEKDQYTKSTAAGSLLEYTIKGSDGRQSFAEKNIDTALATNNGVLGSFTITDSYDEGTQVTTTQTWTVESRFYNLAENQSAQLNQEFEHHVKVVNVNCTNTNGTSPIPSGEDIQGGGIATKLTIVGEGTINDIGTEVAIGDEHFYVISSDATSVTMLAKYNLLVGADYNTLNGEIIKEHMPSELGYNLQSSDARGAWCADLSMTNCTMNATMPFSSTYYWDDGNLKPEYGNNYPAWVYDDNTTVKSYVDEYKNKLEEMGMLIQEARLIKYEELVALGCNASTGTCQTEIVTNNNREWIYQTAYWSGSAASSRGVWFVTSGGYFGGSFAQGFSGGVRPVITISKDLFD